MSTVRVSESFGYIGASYKVDGIPGTYAVIRTHGDVSVTLHDENGQEKLIGSFPVGDHDSADKESHHIYINAVAIIKEHAQA